MPSPIPTFWLRWLQAAIIITLLFGLGFIVAPSLMESLFNLLLFSDTTSPFAPDATAYMRFAYGVLGAVMVGWAVSLWFTATGAFRRGEREGWLTITASIIVWYVVDSAWSVSVGFWQNAALNTVMLILFIIPLAATYRRFFSPNSVLRSATK
jgi:hypothetical protein